MAATRIFDPVAGGEALLVLDAGSAVWSLIVFKDLGVRADARERIDDGSVRVWDLAAGSAALFVLEGHTSEVDALMASSRTRRRANAASA